MVSSSICLTRKSGTWTKPRRVIAKVEWHPGELYPRVGFIVTNLSRRKRAKSSKARISSSIWAASI